MDNYINGVSLPKVEERVTAGSSRTTECNIASIDFGTTHCSVAYCMAGSNSVCLLPLDTYGNFRVPSSILMDSDSNIIAFGHHARKAYSALPTGDKKTHYYFKELKMQLQHDEKVSWSTTVSALNRTKFFLLEVIAMILKYLKNQLLEEKFGNSLRGKVSASDFEWVITVPAMWRSRGKQMMREAAYKAGIASNGVEITCLTPAEYDQFTGKNLITVPPKILDTTCLQPEKLSLAHEPECAALYCLKQVQDKAKTDSSSFHQPKCYMVLDIGGGTVDISVHKIEPNGGVRVLMAPTGNDWGGTRINGKFKEFLAKLVSDDSFHRYLLGSSKPNPKKTSKYSADLDDLINVKFEQQKRLFGNKGLPSDNIVVTLPYHFVNIYDDDLKKGIAEVNSKSNKKIDLSEDELVLPTSIIEEFFADAISEITSCALEALQSLPDDEQIEAAFFVGGFGGCKYLYTKLEKMVKEEYNSSCMTYRPEDHETAVVAGAALFRQNPEIINCRVVDASYGTGCSMRFLPYHNQAYKFYDDDRELHCNHLFAPFTLAGDIVHTDKLLVRTFVPIRHYQSSMKFTIYTSKERDIHYVVREDGKAFDHVTELGELTVNMPDMSGDKKRRVKLFFDFSHTEIQVEAYDLTSGCRATTTIDFLSDIIDTQPQIHAMI